MRVSMRRTHRGNGKNFPTLYRLLRTILKYYRSRITIETLAPAKLA